MHREAEAPNTYENLIRSLAALNKMVMDNVKELTGSKLRSIYRRYCVATGLTVLEHQQQNFAENCGGNFKLALWRLFHYTPHAPLSYWCYAAEFMDKGHRYWSYLHDIHGSLIMLTYMPDMADIFC
jgi:hypothetical protein